jgi:peptidoglycan hydrolase-like amidase
MEIRVWRRALGRVDVVDLEEYVKGVLPSEVFPSWHMEALKANAIWVRSYAYHAITKPHYANADVDDTTRTQVYNPSKRHARTDEAVDATRGLVLLDDKTFAPIKTFYSASCGGSGETSWLPQYLRGHTDCPCREHGRNRSGHGHGGCQWGSQYHALAGRSDAFIIQFYFKNFVLRSILTDPGESELQYLRMKVREQEERISLLEERFDQLEPKEVTLLTWKS